MIPIATVAMMTLEFWRLYQRAKKASFEDNPQKASGCNCEHKSGRVTEAHLITKRYRKVRSHHHNLALREIHHTGSLIDHHKTKRDESVNSA